MERQPIAGKWQVSPGIATRMGAPIIAIGMFSVMYLTNVPGLFAANELVRGLSAQSEGLGKNLEYFKQALARNSFGTQEIREQLVTVANRMTTLQGVDPSLRQEFYTLARTEMQKQIDRVPNDARFDLFMASLFDTYRQYPEAVPYLKKALELSPKKQDIYFILSSVIIFFALKFIRHRQKREGAIFLSYFLLYFVFRFFIEFTRPEHVFRKGLITLPQTISLAGFFLSREK